MLSEQCCVHWRDQWLSTTQYKRNFIIAFCSGRYYVYGGLTIPDILRIWILDRAK